MIADIEASQLGSTQPNGGLTLAKIKAAMKLLEAAELNAPPSFEEVDGYDWKHSED